MWKRLDGNAAREGAAILSATEVKTKPPLLLDARAGGDGLNLRPQKSPGLLRGLEVRKVC